MGTHEDDTPEQTAYWEGVAESENELLTLKARIAELEAEVKAISAAWEADTKDADDSRTRLAVAEAALEECERWFDY